MALRPEQEARLRALTDAQGLDEAAARRVREMAERLAAGGAAPTGAPATDAAPATAAEKPTLFQYLLPFFTVGELRRFLGLPGSMPRVPDDMNAGELSFLLSSAPAYERFVAGGLSGVAAPAPAPAPAATPPPAVPVTPGPPPRS